MQRLGSSARVLSDEIASEVVNKPRPAWLPAQPSFIVASFRAEATCAGAASEVINLADELCSLSPDFSALWSDNDVRLQGEGTKRLRHATHGVIELEYSGFVVDGRPDLSMIVYNPVTNADAGRVRAIVERHLALGSVGG